MSAYNSRASMAVAVLSFGFFLYEALLLPHRIASLQHSHTALSLGIGLVDLIAPLVLVVSGAWLVTKKQSSAALVMLVVFVLELLENVTPTVTEALKGNIGLLDYLMSLKSTYGLMLVVYCLGIYLSLVAYGARARQKTK